jgi:hypothetical protein
MEAVCSSKMLISTYQTTQCRNPEEHNMNFNCHFTLKQSSHFRICVLPYEKILPVPNPTLIPAFSNLRTSQRPLLSDVFELGQCEMDVPRAARTFTSSSLRCIPWANTVCNIPVSSVKLSFLISLPNVNKLLSLEIFVKSDNYITLFVSNPALSYTSA